MTVSEVSGSGGVGSGEGGGGKGGGEVMAAVGWEAVRSSNNNNGESSSSDFQHLEQRQQQ